MNRDLKYYRQLKDRILTHVELLDEAMQLDLDHCDQTFQVFTSSIHNLLNQSNDTWAGAVRDLINRWQVEHESHLRMFLTRKNMLDRANEQLKIAMDAYEELMGEQKMEEIRLKKEQKN